MRLCSICGEKNEDWMNICQRCGNSIVNAAEYDVIKTTKPQNQNYSYSYNQNDDSYMDKESKGSKMLENFDLKLLLIVLLLILIALIAYTIYVII